MDNLTSNYLTTRQACQKYPFLTENMLKNILFKDIDGFRGKVVKMLGRKILLDEQALLSFIANLAPRKTTNLKNK
ncbi:hypothetical protein [Anaplasma marginale]|uniref:hypothetical protein n=1 Tax=Anaplasma marginale TaxID=770 RepID=UPI000305FFFC|nr:hypothetical protein [Anaplasma marginale]